MQIDDEAASITAVAVEAFEDPFVKELVCPQRHALLWALPRAARRCLSKAAALCVTGAPGTAAPMAHSPSCRDDACGPALPAYTQMPRRRRRRRHRCTVPCACSSGDVGEERTAGGGGAQAARPRLQPGVRHPPLRVPSVIFCVHAPPLCKQFWTDSTPAGRGSARGCAAGGRAQSHARLSHHRGGAVWPASHAQHNHAG